MKSYKYNSYSPYGAGEMFCFDCYVGDDFHGNVTEELVKNGAEFRVIDNKNAILIYMGKTFDFVKR